MMKLGFLAKSGKQVDKTVHVARNDKDEQPVSVYSSSLPQWVEQRQQPL
jgi:hypothetical protein